jgi:hypothetical protein
MSIMFEKHLLRGTYFPKDSTLNSATLVVVNHWPKVCFDFFHLKQASAAIVVCRVWSVECEG